MTTCGTKKRGGARAGAGRKRKDPTRPRCATISARVDAETAQKIRAEAKARKISIGDYIIFLQNSFENVCKIK